MADLCDALSIFLRAYTALALSPADARLQVATVRGRLGHAAERLARGHFLAEPSRLNRVVNFSILRPHTELRPALPPSGARLPYTELVAAIELRVYRRIKRIVACVVQHLVLRR